MGVSKGGAGPGRGSTELVVIPSGFLAHGAHYGLSAEAAAALPFLPVKGTAADVEALATSLRTKGVEASLAGHAATFDCSLMAMAHAQDRADRGEPEPADPANQFEAILDSMFPAKATASPPAKPALAERMPGHERRAAIDCALAAGWACIATLASADPARWRTLSYALSDVFGLRMRDLDRITLQSVHRARGVVGA